MFFGTANFHPCFLKEEESRGIFIWDSLSGVTHCMLAARASLHRPTSGQILTPLDFFTFCSSEINALTSL